MRFTLENRGFFTEIQPWYEQTIPNLTLKAIADGKEYTLKPFFLTSVVPPSQKLEIRSLSKFDFQEKYYLSLPSGKYELTGHLSEDKYIDGSHGLAAKVKLQPSQITILESFTPIDKNRRK
jgi:hypothetical protein